MFKNSTPNGCSYADLFIFPNLKKVSAKEAMTKDWYVGCKFYDPAEVKKYPNGYFWRKKGLAEYKTFKERKAAAFILLEEMQRVIDLCYNPIPGICAFKSVDTKYSPNLFITEALEKSLSEKVYTKEHKNIVSHTLEKFKEGAEKLSFHELKIKDVELIHIKKIFDECRLTNYNYNKYKKMLSSLFTDLVDEGCLKVNPCTGIKTKKHIVELKEIFTDVELKEVSEKIQNTIPDFYNFFQIFYMSGCRVPEMLGLKKSDVNLEKSEFTILLRKGGLDVKEKRAIIPNAIPFWENQLKNIKDDEYLFSHGFVNGKTQLNRDYVYKFWKKKIGVKTIYTLKHTFLDKVEEAHFSAQIAAGHRDDRTTSIYTVGREKRRLEAQKQIQIKGF